MPNYKKVVLALGALAMLAPAITFAHGIQLNSRGRFNKPAAIGVVAAVSGNSITLTGKDGTIYTIDATSAKITKFIAGAKTAITPSAIANGDTLVVLGTTSGNAIAATQIMDGSPAAGQKEMFKTNQRPIKGTVTTISGSILTVTSKNSITYTVDATNATFSKFSKFSTTISTAITLADVKIGDIIAAKGTLTGTNMIATAIMDGTMPTKTMPNNGRRGIMRGHKKN